MNLLSIKGHCIAVFLLFAMILSPVWGQSNAASFETRFPSMTWENILAEARGQTVSWYMWGKSEPINKFVNEYLANRLLSEYGVILKMVPVNDPPVFIDKIQKEKQAGTLTNGAVDLVWINGENFRAMKNAKLLFGPYADKLPNMSYVNAKKPNIANDFGLPVEGFESPYGGAQFTMTYDSARIANPPKTIDALIQWIKKNPGKFTFSAPPDFTGSVFLRHLVYYVAGGYEDLVGPFDQSVFDEISPKLWKLLNEIKPYLWQKGRTFPENKIALDDLFVKGELDFTMAYGTGTAAAFVESGKFPKTTRTFIFDSGTLSNTHYVGIAFNSGAKAGAMVLANLILDPATQLYKMDPKVWGDQTVLDIAKLPQDWKDKFAAQVRHPAILANDILSQHQLPELQSSWVQPIEDGFRKNVTAR